MKWKERARQLKRETYALYLAYRDSRTPWYAKVIAGCVVAYAFSPLDLIPDFIPIFGLLDDLILVPLGVALALHMIPPQVVADSRARAEQLLDQGRPINWIAAGIVVLIWLLIAGLLAYLAVTLLHR